LTGLSFFDQKQTMKDMKMKKGMRYHHIGIPTRIPREGEEYLEKFKMWVCGYETSPYGVEWIRFEPDCPLPELVKTVPHVAFAVDDIEKAIAGKNVIIEPNSPSEGVKVAFIEDNGAPVEFLQFEKKAKT
jgi:hypothetical protein